MNFKKTQVITKQFGNFKYRYIQFGGEIHCTTIRKDFLRPGVSFCVAVCHCFIRAGTYINVYAI